MRNARFAAKAFTFTNLHMVDACFLMILGIPWPKHPCTDQALSVVKLQYEPYSFEFEKPDNDERHPRWKREAWEPFTTWRFEVDYELKQIRIRGYLSKYSSHIVEASHPWGRDRIEHRIVVFRDIPLLTLRVNGIDCWFQRKSFVFMIYPTFIRQRKDNENYFELATFTVDQNNRHSPLYTDAYLPTLCRGDLITKGTALQTKRVWRDFDE